MGLMILNIASLLTEFEKTFYTQAIMILLNILFLILALKHFSRVKKYRVFIFYGAAALLQNMITSFVCLADHTRLDPGESGGKIIDIAILFFILIEFMAFYRFFYLQFEGKPVQRKVLMAGGLFIALSLVSTLFIFAFCSYTELHGFIGYLSVASSVFQLVPSFYYFYTLFTDPPVKNLLVEPSFWITTGIAFLHGLNIPIFLVEHYVMQRLSPMWFNLYTINIIAYCFLFLLFMVGVGCDRGVRRRDSKNYFLWRFDKIV